MRDRPDQLSDRLGQADRLDGEFGAGDLMTVSVPPRPKAPGMADGHPHLAARGEARPACKRAFNARPAVRAGTAPAA